MGYGLSIWLDLLALRELGAAREAVVFATAPFVGALFSVVVLRDSLSTPLLIAAGLMAAGVVLLLLEQHSHPHHHESLRQGSRLQFARVGSISSEVVLLAAAAVNGGEPGPAVGGDLQGGLQGAQGGVLGPGGMGASR